MITDVSQDKLYDALNRFDNEFRHTPEWSNWEQKENHKYAISVGGKLYPPKNIVSMATGQPVSVFSGGDETNSILEDRGFKIIELRTNEYKGINPSTAVITGADCRLLGECRTKKIKYPALPNHARDVYVKIHECLSSIAFRVSSQEPYAAQFNSFLTTGFYPTSGVRHNVPKDLWCAIVNKDGDRFQRMPQIYMIVSERGVEYGFAAAVHHSGWSSTEYTKAVRSVVPELFNLLPDPRSQEAQDLEEKIKEAGGWHYRQKTRAPPNNEEFETLASLIIDLKSPSGLQRASGAICRYFLPHDLDNSDVDLSDEFLQAVELFTPLMILCSPSSTLGKITKPKQPQASQSLIQNNLERALILYPQVRNNHAFGTHPELWSVFETLRTALENTDAVKKRVTLKVTWSVGIGKWSNVPWIALLDSRETRSTQSGVYCVFLFRQDMSGVYLTFNQGVTAPKKKHGTSKGLEILSQTAVELRKVCGELSGQGFSLDDGIQLSSDPGLGADYEKSTIAYKLYEAGSVPDDRVIAADLEAVLNVYIQYLTDVEESPAEGVSTEKVWLIAPGRGGRFWEEFLSSSIVAIGWEGIGDLSQYSSTAEIATALIQAGNLDSHPRNDARACFDFVQTMQPGDLVFAKGGNKIIVGYGIVSSGYRYDSSRNEFRNVRSVNWIDSGNWDINTLGPNYESYQFPVKTLTDIAAWPDMVADLKKLVGFDNKQTKTVVIRQPAYTLSDFAEETGFEVATIEKWRTRLKRKQHVVFQGPPGTGKTFVAERLARIMCSETTGFWDLVQFHPSYTYEDFMQGIRPDVFKGQLTFNMKAGRFLSFCKKVSEVKDGSPCVLIIDEINRANLSRVFGEVMYLLEYRDKSIPLAGSDTPFSIPQNLYLIGTMNTADRSIALVDHALRRRFSFIHLGPEYEVLRKRLVHDGLPTDSLIKVLQAVNRAIEDRHYELGISYFMKDGANLRKTLPEIWEGEIEPYLEEYFYDQPEKIGPFRWEKLAETELADWKT